MSKLWYISALSPIIWSTVLSRKVVRIKTRWVHFLVMTHLVGRRDTALGAINGVNRRPALRCVEAALCITPPMNLLCHQDWFGKNVFVFKAVLWFKVYSKLLNFLPTDVLKVICGSVCPGKFWAAYQFPLDNSCLRNPFITKSVNTVLIVLTGS